MQRQPNVPAAAFLYSGCVGGRTCGNLRRNGLDKPTAFEAAPWYTAFHRRWDMAVYWEGVVVFNGVVDFLLILATNQLTRAPRRM